MRQPTFNRARRVRQQRLLRTGIGVVVLVAIAALLVNILGGDSTDPVEQPPNTPLVAFRTTGKGFSDKQRVAGPQQIKKGRLTPERDEITQILDNIYQLSFIDPAIMDDATTDQFPTDAIAAYFAEDARTTLTEEVDALTLGTERGTFSAVEPGRTRAKVSVFFTEGERPTFATADVTFTATGTLDDTTAQPVRIKQEAVFHFTRSGKGWLVTYFDAKQTQESLEPEPTATGTSS